MRKWLGCIEIISIFSFHLLLILFYSIHSVIKDFNDKGHEEKGTICPTTVLKWGLAYCSIAIPCNINTHTHTASANLLYQPVLHTLARDIYIADLLWKPALPLLYLAFLSVVPSLFVWTGGPLPESCFLAAGLTDVLQSISRELPVYLSPSLRWSSCVQALLCINWWNVRTLMRILVCLYVYVHAHEVCKCVHTVYVWLRFCVWMLIQQLQLSRIFVQVVPACFSLHVTNILSQYLHCTL